ncbi:MAG TPA: NADH-quinone oxidoreductase subunit B [Actinobacteria bacterium]|jgi:NADH-quinone oxidoreductase subunit B|nr:NADH-quinone oxidoreductase subunit B [Actinomycetota bacterium]
MLDLRLADDAGVSVSVLSLGLACCAVEVDAAVQAGLLIPSDTIEGPAPRLTVLVVAGTVTAPLVPVVESALAALPATSAVLAFGACASTGGPYWDSPSVINGVDRLVEVRQYVPGCPPRPEALCDALREMA